ncbi:MAG: class F sortase [Anaerolineaceae bacterium]|nr:class F sortase [Anaerolineaceae bacterium]
MNRIQKIIICLIAAVFVLSGCSSLSSAGNSVMEFFGFRTTVTPAAPLPAGSPSADADPFGSGETTGKPVGSGIAGLNWDDPDPALVEINTSDPESKDGSYDWTQDPFAYSFSDSTYDSSEQKSPYYNQPYTIRRPTATPSLIFYPLQNNPVFRPMCELPRTGISGSAPMEINESVSYTETSMSLSIPTLNVNEKIVVVPLVDDNFPVESLGENIGLLEGSGPGAEDLFVLAGHNHLNTEEKGPFATLSALKESDLIFIRGAKDASRTYVVYANEKFASDDIDGLLSYAKPGCMILITCEDESIEGGYLNRRVVFADPKED